MIFLQLSISATSCSFFRECHVETDWQFVYAVDKGQLILAVPRPGTHSDLFY